MEFRFEQRDRTVGIFRGVLTIGLVDQTAYVAVGRLVTIGLAERPEMRGRYPAVDRRRSSRRGLHHAERGVRAYVVVDAFVAAARAHLFTARIVSHSQRGTSRSVFDPFLGFVTAFPLDRTTAAAATTAFASSTQVPRAVIFPTRPKQTKKPR